MTDSTNLQPQMTNDRKNATVFAGSIEDAKKIEERLTARFHESGRDFYVTTMNAAGTRPVDFLFQFRVDHTGRENWISNRQLK